MYGLIHSIPTKEQENALEAFFEAFDVSFDKRTDERLPEHVLKGIVEGEKDYKAGRYISFEEFKSKMLLFK